MNRACSLLTVGLAACHIASAQTGMVCGHVIDDKTEEAVWGAVVELSYLQRRTQVLCKEGSFSLDSLSPGSDTLRVKALAYYGFILPILIKPDTVTTVDFKMTIVTGHPDSGECSTPVHANPPPDHYIETHSTVTYSPMPRNGEK